MSVVVIEPPEPIVSLTQAKRQLRVELEDSTDDEMIEGLIAAATATIDGPSGWLGRALGRQTLELRGPCFLPGVELPYQPVISVESVIHVDAAGTEQTIAPEGYFLEAGRFVRPVSGWIGSLAWRSDEVRIRYVAGWPMSDGNSPVWTGPAPIRQAVLMMVTRLYANRGEDRPTNAVEDPAINALLSPWRVWSL
ncbi:head-tail connector protein [uncultured Enterovirga sp.]|uniref:head-tail connector protein n=1 Tax=uncultured Enterovirga sp. TaxID=2026352 RepID=UPI0035CAA8D1